MSVVNVPVKVLEETILNLRPVTILFVSES